ncbi:MAG: hypothetical protein ACLS4Z_10075 [Christensenellaceae bacterium]
MQRNRYIAQSTVTKRISELKRGGKTAFSRGSKTVTLTEKAKFSQIRERIIELQEPPWRK